MKDQDLIYAVGNMDNISPRILGNHYIDHGQIQIKIYQFFLYRF